MPALGTNPNVACYMDDLYVYLRARANDAWGRARPSKHEDKPDAYTTAERAAWASSDGAKRGPTTCPMRLTALTSKKRS